ncbi:hypothetical protein CORC01_07411 [Colletotrichum orchidophilum]|uniref:Uncharacterized protein n=1 Tax=Colletotrichum orchidophilum TaxID=1209926 RepID=A0A1G4B7P1_9PEZI|nr:hypothetical protein CORC01_07411 [Colletotrichum orchidophilum]
MTILKDRSTMLMEGDTEVFIFT